MDYEDLIRRIRNMQCYGLSLTEIHDRLKSEDVEEHIIFFVYKGASFLNEDHTL